jgi:AbrB family looped-hinge helix DNA binding protein
MQGRARINQQGRIVIPAECRAAAGLKPGDDLIVETVGHGELRIRTKEQALKEAQRIVVRYGSGSRDLVAELIAERREEAARE